MPVVPQFVACISKRTNHKYSSEHRAKEPYAELGATLTSMVTMTPVRSSPKTKGGATVGCAESLGIYLFMKANLDCQLDWIWNQLRHTHLWVAFPGKRDRERRLSPSSGGTFGSNANIKRAKGKQCCLPAFASC